MPYCCQCGKPTHDTDIFCAACGGRQPVNPSRGEGISPRTASIVCYIPVLGWIPAVIVLAARRFRQDKNVRFHAFQGIYLFVAWLIVDWVLGPITGFRFGHGIPGFWALPGLTMAAALKGVLFIAWIYMLVKTSQDEMIKLPVLGELAERSVAEQR
jgi:uncharacterized membrane protein